MSRVSPRLLLVLGALLVALRVVVPLSSSPSAQPPIIAAPSATAVDLPPELDDVNREVDRLRDRLADPAQANAPRRDPFRFANPIPGDLDTSSPAVTTMPAAEPVRAAVAWPVLVAILTSGDAAAPAYRAVFEDTSGVVHVRSAAESLGGFTVGAVTGEAVTVEHRASGESTQLILR